MGKTWQSFIHSGLFKNVNYICDVSKWMKMKYFCLVKDFEFKSFFLNSHAHIRRQRIPNRNRNGLLIRGNNRINIVMLIFYLMPPGKMKIYNMTHLHYDQKIKPSENSLFKCSLITIFKKSILVSKVDIKISH